MRQAGSFLKGEEKVKVKHIQDRVWSLPLFLRRPFPNPFCGKVTYSKPGTFQWHAGQASILLGHHRKYTDQWFQSYLKVSALDSEARGSWVFFVCLFVLVFVLPCRKKTKQTKRRKRKKGA